MIQVKMIQVQKHGKHQGANSKSGTDKVMTVRTSCTTVTFQRPFMLPSMGHTHPAGTYKVSMNDEAVSCTPFVNLKRIATHIHTPALSMMASAKQVFEISSEELSIAVEQDVRRKTTVHYQASEMRA
jgi:hypothetical protein